MPTLDFLSWTEKNLGDCQGDCDSDADCKPGLKCFQRNAKEAVPGCLPGTAANNVAYADYCYAPPAPPPTLDFLGWTETNLGKCQGDCDSDADCKAGLKCFQRDGTTPVPGCLPGSAANNVGYADYCV
jgi:hypothetical protein